MRRSLCVPGLALVCLILVGCGHDSSPDAASSSPADVQAGGSAAAVSGAQPRPVQYWQCGDRRLGAEFDPGTGILTLSYEAGDLNLRGVEAASGARYADSLGNEFWSKGAEAMLTLAGAAPQQCARTEHASPWTEARARGATFRAIGNEPGWSVEVGGGEAPRLSAVLDYGERKLDVAAARPLAGGEGFVGGATDGTPVALRIARGSCSDGMSDAIYPVRAELEVGDARYTGCGRFLNR